MGIGKNSTRLFRVSGLEFRDKGQRGQACRPLMGLDGLIPWMFPTHALVWSGASPKLGAHTFHVWRMDQWAVSLSIPPSFQNLINNSIR